MKVTTASIVRGTTQPGVEVEFRGEGVENVLIHLRNDDISSMRDDDIFLHVKQLLTQVVAFEKDLETTKG
jgi:hypothetical protein